MTDELLIPDYTAADFENSTVPYEFLYQYRDNKFLLAQTREKLKRRALEVGVKGFIGLWNAYLETLQKSSGFRISNVTYFDGQPIELVSGKYICDDYGVTISDSNGYEVSVCKHPIMPVERLINIDSGDERLRIAYKKGQRWRTLIAEKTVLASNNGIISLAANGVLVNAENSRQLSTYLLEMEQLNYDDLPEQKSVGRLGWVGEGLFSPYVDGIVFDGEATFRQIFDSVGTRGDFLKWLEAIKSLRALGLPGRLFLAASFASVILEPCGLLPFFLHTWGGSGCGKTVGLMIAASVWANPKVGEYVKSFNSTAVAQELKATCLNSLPMCLDELQIQASQGIKDFDKVIYQLSEGIGRDRGAKTGGLQRTGSWRNCILTNGEQPITSSTSGGGAVNRIIEFECTDKVYNDLPGIVQIISHNYGHAGKYFVDYLQRDGSIDHVKEVQKKYYNLLLNTESTDKQAASASALLAADEIVTELIFMDGNNLTVDDVAQIMASKNEVNQNLRIMDFIAENVAVNINRFRTNDFGDYPGEVWGDIDNNGTYIIKSVFDKMLAAEGFNSRSFLSWAKRMNKIKTAGGKNTVPHRVGGMVTRCVCIVKNYDDSDKIETQAESDYGF